MRRLVICLALLALAAPGSAAAGALVTAFYYPWYGTPALDGGWEHWNQNGHTPPGDLASAYYPLLGAYSSSDPAVLSAQMDELRRAGVDAIAVSWWGRGSPEDARLPLVLSSARAAGLAVAAHLEPYAGRTVASVAADVGYLDGLGIRTFYVYRALDLPVVEWQAATPQLHAAGNTLYAQTPYAGAAAAAGFQGVYTYDIVTFSGDKFGRICGEAHALHLLCAPSVGPGYDARRADGDPRVKPRRNGATYDHMWGAAIAAHADAITITSFNEWHEGTQIEPASPRPRHGTQRYLTYDGAYGLHGRGAAFAYLERTAYWSSVFRSTRASQPKTRAS
ncbi:MAG TPA: hypothetical protein VFA05_03815 [Gaiellaceae bacterium]|nr:hypothetical protein [Gaiellaceae bacterium]